MRLVVTASLFLFVSCLLAQEVPDMSFQLVNSLYDEQNPIVTPDGQTLFFTVSNHPKNIGGKKDAGDIWFSRWMGKQWSAPVHAGSLLNDRAYNAVAGISGDGKYLILHGHYDPAGTAKTQGISVSENSGRGWSRPENIIIPYFHNKSTLLSGTISNDGLVFIFSAESYGTRGVDDIYVSIKSAGKWSEPKNLGAAINTQFEELCPSLSNDGRTLYFSSNGLKGSGSFDIFSATRLDNTWTKWSTPQNLGTSINSGGRDLYFRNFPALGYGLFTSTINSDGYGDIKIHHIEEPITPQDSAVLIAEPLVATVDSARIAETKYDTAKNPDVVKVYGKVINSKTGEVIKAQVAFVAAGLANQNILSGNDGYTISISSVGQYTIFIEAQGYISTMEKLAINTYEMDDLEMNFTLQPVEVGTTVNLKNVLFAQTKADILPESFPELDLVVNFLKTNPNVKIDLSGHTDNRGVHADNVKLSQQRVNKVRDYLISKGVDSKRISGKGFGGTKPIASNDTEESRKMNRRVEFTIKKF
jgi:OmpA-OmpF porin, OOP family